MKRLLIVDDLPQNLYLLEMLLKSSGYDVEKAVNGSEALALALKNPPDMIISDVLMPIMDGFSLCRECKTEKRLQGIPFIFYTATYTDPKDEEFGLRLGADRFLVKPIAPEAFLDTVREVLLSHDLEKRVVLPELIEKEESYYKEYNERLIHKLEEEVAQVEMTKKRLYALYKVSSDMARIKSGDEIFRYVLRSIVETAGYQQATYFRYEEGGQKLKVLEAFGELGIPFGEKSQEVAFDLGDKRGLVGWVGATGQASNIPDVAKEPDWLPFHPGIRSALFIPVQYDGHLQGVIALFSTEPDDFSVEDEQNITALANSLAITIVNRKAEEEIRQLNALLEQRIRERTAQLEITNQELEAFSYSVSHDLRAPLRVLAGFSKIIGDEYGGTLDAEGNQYLIRIQEAAEHMGELIEALLELSSVSRREMVKQQVDLSRITREIISELKMTAPQRKVEVTVADGLVVYGDEDLLQIVMQNLLDNAWKYSGKCFLAKIEVGKLPGDPQSGNEVYFVRDNGAGFDMAHADRLFAPFQRLHRVHEYPGTGVGLSTVKRIINRHGGKIWAEAAINQGATFYFMIGLEEGKTSQVSKTCEV